MEEKIKTIKNRLCLSLTFACWLPITAAEEATNLNAATSEEPIAKATISLAEENDHEFKSKVNKRIEAYERAFRAQDICDSANYTNEFEKIVQYLKGLFSQQKPTNNRELIAAYAVNNPDKDLTFSSEHSKIIRAVNSTALLQELLFRKTLAYSYKLIYEKVRHKHVYDTDDTVEKMFPDPSTFRKTATAFHYYNQRGRLARLFLPKKSFPDSMKKALATYINNLEEEKLVPYLDGITGRALYTFEDIAAKALVGPECKVTFTAIVNTKAPKKHTKMGVVSFQQDGECRVWMDGEMQHNEELYP